MKIYSFAEVEAYLAEAWAKVEPFLAKLYDIIMSVK